MKTLALIVRRPDHTRERFRAHYEEIHAPLAMETVMEGTTRYVRHHVHEELHGAPIFDVVTAFRYRNAQDAAALIDRLGTEQGQRIIADEHTFMDRERNTFFAVEEVAVRGAEDRSAGASIFALARAPAGVAREAFVMEYEAQDVPALLDATEAPVWCLQNRAQAFGADAPAYDVATQVHAAAPGDVAAWARGIEERGADVLVFTVHEDETETPWN